jgi:hypothetical protein
MTSYEAARARFADAVERRDRPAAASALTEMKEIVADLEMALLDVTPHAAVFERTAPTNA